MRHIKKKFDVVPTDLQSVKCKEKIADALVLLGEHKFDSATYGSDIVREALDTFYHNKCAFCETDPSAGATPQVDHYRPKAKVTGEMNHPGYYWLGYEWSNLLLACPACNNRKRNQFPVTGVRVLKHPVTQTGDLDTANCQSTSAMLQAEQPQLINPEIEPTPMRHFRFTRAGKLLGQTPEGVASITGYNLNRKNLITARKAIVFDTLYESLLTSLSDFHNGTIADPTVLDYLLRRDLLKLVNHLTDVKKQYLAYARVCWDNFDAFFIDLFPSATDQEYLRKAYTKVANIPEVKAILA